MGSHKKSVDKSVVLPKIEMSEDDNMKAKSQAADHTLGAVAVVYRIISPTEAQIR